MSEPSISALPPSAPPLSSEGPISSKMPAHDPLMCVDPASGGSEGASNAGTEALVRRFAAPLGTGGTGGMESDEPTREEPSDSCGDDAGRAIATCGAAVFSATTTAGIGALLLGLGCVGQVGGLVECLDNQAKAKKP